MANLLLHSMTNFKEIFKEVLINIKPKIIVEIGCEYAGSTIQFLEYCKENESVLYIIDPNPFVDVDKTLINYSGYYKFIKKRSIEALKDIPKADLYIIDGDHNYWTVMNELKIIFEDNTPLAILHDVGFPCDRRDLYYNPKDIPNEFLHKYSYKHGININNDIIPRGGFHGAGEFAFSVEKNKDKMGVLTAIEEFILYNKEFRYQYIPLIFGVGFIAKEEVLAKISYIISPYQIELMENLERNRMELYLKVLELQDELDKLRESKIVRLIEKMKKR